MSIAPLKDRFAHEILDGSYALLKMVRKGEKDVNIEFLIAARTCINEIERELNYGRKRK